MMVSDYEYNSHKNNVINEPSLIMIHNVVTMQAKQTRPNHPLMLRSDHVISIAVQEQLSMVVHGLQSSL